MSCRCPCRIVSSKRDEEWGGAFQLDATQETSRFVFSPLLLYFLQCLQCSNGAHTVQLPLQCRFFFFFRICSECISFVFVVYISIFNLMCFNNSSHCCACMRWVKKAESGVQLQVCNASTNAGARRNRIYTRSVFPTGPCWSHTRSASLASLVSFLFRPPTCFEPRPH